MGELKRVVGKDAASPWCHDIIFALAFVAHVAFIFVLFCMWAGEGAPGLPSKDHADVARSYAESYANTTLTAAGEATALTFLYSIIFASLWVFVYLGIMRVAAWGLIIGLNLVMVCCFLGFGLYFITWANDCKDFEDYPGPCSTSEQGGGYLGGAILCICALLHLLWMICVRARIALTATMLKAVSSIISVCPGIVLLAYAMALASVFWTLIWMGAFVQANIMLAGGVDAGVEAWSSDTLGSFVGLMFGMLISFFWGYRVINTISTMTTSHVVASWYFDPDCVNEGMPCCRPVTLVGLKRSCLNYLGSISFGTLIIAILDALYYTVKYCAERMPGGDNPVVKVIVCCFLCILDCLKKTIEWLTEWAFVFITIYGCSFFQAGSKVVGMLFDSGMGAVAQSTLIYPVVLFGRIIGGCAGVGAGFLTLETHDINYEWTQPIIGFLVAFALSSVALACVDAGNKAIFVCYVDFPEHIAARLPDVAEQFKNNPKNKMGKGAAASQVDVEIKP